MGKVKKPTFSPITRVFGENTLSLLDLSESGRNHWSAGLFNNGEKIADVYYDNGNVEFVFDEGGEQKMETLRSRLSEFPAYTERELKCSERMYGKSVAAKLQSKKATPEIIVSYLATKTLDEKDKLLVRDDYLKMHQGTSLCFEREDGFICRQITDITNPIGPRFRLTEEIRKTIDEFEAKGYWLINTNMPYELR